MAPGSIRRQDHSGEGQPAALDCRISGNRGPAGSVKRSQKGTLAGQRPAGLAMIDAGNKPVDGIVADAALDADRALPRRRRKGVERHDVGSDLLEAQPPQAGKRQDRAGSYAFTQFSQPGLHIAAKHDDVEIWTHASDQRLPPQRGRANSRAMRKIGDAQGRIADESITRIFALQKCGKLQPIR